MELIHYLLIAIIVIQVLHFVFYLSSPADKYQLQTTLEIREKLNELEKKIDSKLQSCGGLD